MTTVEKLIGVAGVVQLLIATANIFLPRKLRYADNLGRVDAIIRQVFVVHSVYIVLVLVGLAGLCFFFAGELAGASGLGKCLSWFIALFWGARVFIQLFYYDAAVKRENLTMHVVFTTAFVYLATVFAVAAIGG